MTQQPLAELLIPSQFSKDGYMGNDTRSLQQIEDDDKKTLAALGLDNKKLVAELRKLYILGERALGNPVDAGKGTTVTFFEARGRIPSPFKEDGTFQKGEVELVNTAKSITIHITPLSLHLMEKYCFFQGKGSPYRVEPEQAAQLVGFN
jgi:hypothetical protein